MQVTEWFPGSINPVRDGWYEVNGEFLEGWIARRYWAGKWMWRGISGADEFRPAAFSKKEDLWRGVINGLEDEQTDNHTGICLEVEA